MTATVKFFRIVNDWDSRNYCPLDNSWVNDGRASTVFKTEEEAQSFIKGHEDEERMSVEACEYEIDEE